MNKLTFAAFATLALCCFAFQAAADVAPMAEVATGEPTFEIKASAEEMMPVESTMPLTSAAEASEEDLAEKAAGAKKGKKGAKKGKKSAKKGKKSAKKGKKGAKKSKKSAKKGGKKGARKGSKKGSRKGSKKGGKKN